jgi:pimeloyl-ACP methyl ester carboxylesterase
MLECQLKNATIKYESYGEGHPILIMHGAGPNDHHWMQSDLEPLFEKRRGWHRIYLDQPGHGKTEWPQWITSQDQVLDLLCDFIDQIIPGKPFTLAGLSWGGMLSLGIISRRVEMVEGLFLSVPTVNVEKSKRNLPEHITLVKDHDFVEKLQEDEKWITNVLVVQNPTFLERLGNEIFEVNRENDKHNRKFDISTPLSYSARQIFFSKPTLMLTGRQDNVVGYRDAWDLIENFPRATYAVLDRAGHFLSIEQNTLMKALIDEWLDRVEESRSK